jgi:DNA primase
MSNSLNIDPTTTKYLIRATINADGVVEKPDVVGAIFGQTEGLLGEDLDLRDLQKSGRIGRIEVVIDSKKGKSIGEVVLPSSLDKVETCVIGAALESIDRVGPAKAEIKVKAIEDVRSSKREQVISRARELLASLGDAGVGQSESIMESVRDSMRVEDMVSYGPERLPAGPNVSKSDSIIVVEGRNDVANLLKHGIKNAIAVEGTNVPKTIIDLCKEKSAIAFVDGDRGGELILKELMQVAEIDFIARAPRANEVEELTQKQLIKALRNKIPADQFQELYSLEQGRARDTRDNPRGRGHGRGQAGNRPMLDEEDEDEDVDLTSPIEGVDMTPMVSRQPPQQQQRRDDRRDERRDERREGGRRDDRRDDRGRGDRRDDRRDDRRNEGRGRMEREERRPEREFRDERREERMPREERAPPAMRDAEPDVEPAAAAEPAMDAEPTMESRGGEERELPETGRPKGDREGKYLEILEELSGKLQAVLLNDQLERVGDKVAVRDLADTLKKDLPGVTTVVFDGVVTQRLIDIALDKKIATLVGVKTGNITKKPNNVEVVTRADLA